MAGMDWFRWHHGSVTDPKFQLVARKSGSSVAEVIGVWATLLEAASMSEVRGCHGALDFESLDCALGLPDGKAEQIYTLMVARGLVDDDAKAITSWSKRQPARERDDDKSTDRVKAFREKQRHETPCNASETPCNAEKRLEEIRGDKSNTPPTPVGGGEDGFSAQKPKAIVFTAGFVDFWETWPANDRKQARGKCFEVWKKARLEADAALICAHVSHLKTTKSWTKDAGQFVPAPLVYLNGKCWDGAAGDAPQGASVLAGAL